MPEFFEAEEIGISLLKTCRGCRECSNSDLSGEGVGHEDEVEFDVEKERNRQKSGEKNRRRYSLTTPARKKWMQLRSLGS